jgi:hypothetical protein
MFAVAAIVPFLLNEMSWGLCAPGIGIVFTSFGLRGFAIDHTSMSGGLRSGAGDPSGAL